MKLSEVKEYIYDLASKYFAGATIVWDGEYAERPPVPYLHLRMDTLNTSEYPSDTYFDDTGLYTEAYQADFMLEAKLYTRGADDWEEGSISSSMNTALSDLHLFANYMKSRKVLDRDADMNVCFEQEGQVNDTSVVINNNKREFSSMVEYHVYFVMENKGGYGISDVVSETDPITGEEKKTITTDRSYSGGFTPGAGTGAGTGSGTGSGTGGTGTGGMTEEEKEMADADTEGVGYFDKVEFGKSKEE